jgi:hypothetical protein
MTMNSKSNKAEAKERKSKESDQEESGQEESDQEESDQEESEPYKRNKNKKESEPYKRKKNKKESYSDSEPKEKIKKVSKSTKSIVIKVIESLRLLIEKELDDDKLTLNFLDSIYGTFALELVEIITTENAFPKKVKKDPNAPTKAMSSYILFCSDNRASVKEKFPDYKQSHIVSELGSKWKKSSEKTKKKYAAKALKDKERYLKEFEEYSPSDGFEKPEVKAPKKDPKSPKRGTTAYIYFCQDKRPKLKDSNPEMKGKEITTELSSMWKNISDKKRVKYTDLATEDKKRYTDELKEYVPSDGFEKPITKAKAKSATIKAARSAFMFFSLKKKESIKEGMEEGSSSKEVTAEVGRIWKEKYKGNEKKSKRYVKAAEKDKTRYIKESAEFIKNSGDDDDDDEEEQ